MRSLVLLMTSGCAVIPVALRPAPDPRVRPEWVDVHERAFYEKDGEVILVYGVGSLRADSELCRPDLVRPVLEGRTLPPMQHLLGNGETLVSDHVAVIDRSGARWNHTGTTRVRRASGSLFMVTTQAAWYDRDARELHLLQRAVASSKGLDLLPPVGIDTSSPQSYTEALSAYLAECAPEPQPEWREPSRVPSLEVEVSACTGACRQRPEPCAPGCSDTRRVCQTRACQPVLVTDLAKSRKLTH